MDELEQKLIAVLNESTIPFDMKAYVVKHVSEIVQLKLQNAIIEQRLKEQENPTEEKVDE